MGRPKQHTKAKVEATIRKRKGLLHLVCMDLKVSYRTLTFYRSEWPELDDLIYDVREYVLDEAEDALYKMITKGLNLEAIKFILLTKGRDRGYVIRKEFRHGGDPNAPPISVTPQKGLTVDEILALVPLQVKKKLLEEMKKKETPTPVGFLPPGTNGGNGRANG